MTNFIAVNYGYLLIAAIGLILLGYGLKNLKKPLPEIPTTQSVNFNEDTIYSTPVMANNPHADIFREAASAAILEGKNPWDYLKDEWEKTKDFNGSVEKALLDFITNEARQNIPDSAKVSLSIRDYSNPNSIVMEYRDPAKDSVMVATGHDPEPALYGTFYNKRESRTFKLLCANGMVRELGKGEITSFEEDYEIKFGDSFIGITGSTPGQAAKFAEENNLPVRFIVAGFVTSKTPDFSKAKVYKDFAKEKKGIFDVIIQPGDILRKKEGKWLYIKTE